MFHYIKTPRYQVPQQANGKEKLAYLLKSWGVVIAINIALTFFIFVINFIITKYFHQASIMHESNALTYVWTKYKSWGFLFIVFIGPFLEETMFRLGLNFKRKSVATGIGLLCLLLSGLHLFSFNFFLLTDYIKLFSAIAAGLLAAILFTQPFLDKIKEKYFAIFFYASATAFALVHLSNFTPINYKLIYIYPLLVLPQFAEGLFIGNIRMRYGFIWGFFLHGLTNLLPAIVFLVNH